MLPMTELLTLKKQLDGLLRLTKIETYRRSLENTHEYDEEGEGKQHCYYYYNIYFTSKLI